MRANHGKKFYQDRFELSCSISPENDGVRLDQFVQIHFPSFTREFIKKKIDKGEVKITTRPGVPKPSSRLRPWDEIFIVCYRDKIEDEYWKGEKIEFDENLEIIYDHAGFCVVNKPAFMCAHPTGRHVFYCATVYAERKLGMPCATVHRLDRETSGLLILSKDPVKGKLLTSLFEQHKVQKFYFFISAKSKDISFPLVAHERIGENPHSPSRIVMHCFDREDTQGKKATTYFDLIAQSQDFLCGLAMPKSGRQHQIRTHASHHGLPLVGDKIYGNDKKMFAKFKDGLALEMDYVQMMIPRHALHAAAMTLQTDALMQTSFFAPLPQDLKHFIQDIMKFDPDEIEVKLKQKIEEWQIKLTQQDLK